MKILTSIALGHSHVIYLLGYLWGCLLHVSNVSFGLSATLVYSATQERVHRKSCPGVIVPVFTKARKTGQGLSKDAEKRNAGKTDLFDRQTIVACLLTHAVFQQG